MKLEELSRRVGFELREIREGKTRLIVPRVEKEEDIYEAPVFYNPRMALSRDVGVLVVEWLRREVGREVRICEPMTGIGARGIRYVNEVEGTGGLLSDTNPVALVLTYENAKLNGILDRIDIEMGDARFVLSASYGKFDLVDVDPFGTPAPFVESAILALRKGGILAVTATDMRPLCGIKPYAALRKYGSLPLKTEYCHEIALRIVLAHIAKTAALQERWIRPLVSHYAEHYVRAIVRVFKGKGEAREQVRSLKYIAHCPNCSWREVSNLEEIPRECPRCRSRTAVGGPIWAGNFADVNACARLIEFTGGKELQEKERVRKMLDLISNEQNMPPYFYSLHEVARALKTSAPKMVNVIEELRSRGFKASRTHFSPLGIKTDAGIDEVEEVVRCLSRR